MSDKLKIYVLNTISAGAESLNIIKKEIKIDGIIGLNKNHEDINVISGFYDMKKYCEKNNMNFIGIDTYKINKDCDIKKIKELQIDILLVLGWQRLIPDWLINHVRIACIGGHGSPWGIEKGRGRSPINWSLILDKKNFIIDIFKVNAGIDSGEVIDESSFMINEFDDVNSIYYKVSWSVAQMIIKNIKNGNILDKIYKKQNNYGVRYLPQRTPEDGEIDWNRTNIEVYNFIRALTKPYPGAFSYLHNTKVFIWRAIPFEDMIGFEKYQPGEVVKYYSTNNEFLIKCKIGALLVKEYSGEMIINDELENHKFSNANFNEQMQKIISRHYIDYKNNKCNDELLHF
ncbi:formyltransferase family protein [Clostridium sp. YIM B02500]|uniref:methionyl-tRNA formyltransferase n=1 Tax=Clostridium sp. YIM B02500 TaxID=2910681 RepID=UPI001EEF3699|nr:formyltransferase family protein [Clostridium sp. YIM B02500]